MFRNNKGMIFLGSMAAITVIFATSVWAAVDISEVPLDAQTKPAPASIMFILDDSGSMDWEIMTDEPNGLFLGDFAAGTDYPYEYVFDDAGDNEYSSSSKYATILTTAVRSQWKSQWFGYNKMYYDPAVTYVPWPTRDPADPNNPRSHPYIDDNKFDLSASYFAGATLQGGGTFNIPRAHYYVRSAGATTPYLVTLDSVSSTVKYYATTISSGSGASESVGTYIPISTPSGVRDYTEERQNFANWYSFYRRRELTAIAAVSNVISQMAGVQIGITTINKYIQQPVLKVKIGGVDNTSVLLAALYGMDLTIYGGTPLRTGLQSVGKYFHGNDGETGGIGVCANDQFYNSSTPTVNSTCPYWRVKDGGECQQAFAILMTDGHYNKASPVVGNVDGLEGQPFADIYSDTLADVAMLYWKNDLSTGLKNLITPSPLDPATYQHMVTFGVSFGVAGTLNPANYDLSASPPPTILWPDPEEDKNTPIPGKIDDLFHASVNGHGTFLNASNPIELVNSLLYIMKNIEQRIGSSSSVSVNGDELYKRIDDNTYMFQSSYNTTGWLGDINSYKVNSTTGAIDLTNPTWSASTVWQAETWSTYWNTRPIATYTGSAGVPFRIGSLTTAQKTMLDPVPATAQLVLNYVRGDDSEEQLQEGAFRNRSSRLGDIVHSSPIYHNGILYTGANDGMMHAIRAEGPDAGSEIFSYVPSQVIQNLSLLTDPAYTHNYYVDLTVTVKDNVLAADSTLLVGGLGQGGIGYYALDISNLSSLTSYPVIPATIPATTIELWNAPDIAEATLASMVLWEFPNAATHPLSTTPPDPIDDLSDIGYSFSKSLIVKTNDTNYPWVVIFGNGYNSVDGQSVLFILDPANGDVLRKFELGLGPDNGLSTPSVTDVDGDGKADYVYAGDLAGNMWKIDLTDTDYVNWDVAFAHTGVNAPLFKAIGPTGISQPITAKPDVMYHPQYHGYLVAFGTGKFLGTTDFLDKTVQTVYGVWDYGDDSDNTENLGTFDPATEQVSTLSFRSTLLEQGLLVPDFTYDPDSTVTGDEEIVRVLTDNAITWRIESDSTAGELPDLSTSTANNAGWYFDLPNTGERVVSRMMIRDGKAIFISFTPDKLPCTTGGDSILHEVDAADGSRMNRPTFDTNGDGVINSSDIVTVTVDGVAIDVFVTGIQREGHLQTPAILKLSGTEVEIKYMSSTAGTIETVEESAAKTGISSWREL